MVKFWEKLLARFGTKIAARGSAGRLCLQTARDHRRSIQCAEQRQRHGGQAGREGASASPGADGAAMGMQCCPPAWHTVSCVGKMRDGASRHSSRHPLLQVHAVDSGLPPRTSPTRIIPAVTAARPFDVVRLPLLWSWGSATRPSRDVERRPPLALSARLPPERHAAPARLTANNGRRRLLVCAPLPYSTPPGLTAAGAETRTPLCCPPKPTIPPRYP